MIIDFHTHSFPDALAKSAIPKISAEAGELPYYTDGTEKGLSDAAREAGIDLCVVLPIAVKPHQMRKVNTAALEAQNNKNIKGLLHFGSIHPLAPDAIDELAWLKDNGFLGIKLHPEYQSFEVDDSRVFDVYQAIGDYGMTVTFHAGYDLGFGTPPNCAPHKLKKALPYLKKAKVIAAHMGGMGDWLNVQEHLLGFERLYLDTSFSFMHIPPMAAKNLINLFGADKILFGSDSPWADMQKEMRFVQQLGLTEGELSKIMGENGKALLGL